MNIDTFELKTINRYCPQPIDAFIGCASFEERSTTIARELKQNNVKQVILLQNHLLNAYNDASAKFFTERYKEKLIPAVLDMSDPVKTQEELWNALKQLKSTDNILVDITTFTRESLLILLDLLKRYLHKTDTLKLVYTPAKEYFSGGNRDNTNPLESSIENQNSEIWLSKGVREVRSVLGYPGTILPSKRVHLMVMIGFELERTETLLERYEPDLISIGCSHIEGAFSESFYKTNINYFDRISVLHPNIEQFYFWPNDPFKTKRELANHIAQFKEYNTVIAPLNNKISTVGAALLTWEMDKVQLCYAQADIYNYKSYSTPSQDCCMIDLNGIGER